ncbi:DUF421 domain-containing protein [Neobacillus sp. PS3-40]|uniref:DUF421 domain-containing protein n=1 Tax=Neobacillus sp. PS3-40 TaxID=3070679 RepID=UPI0027E14C03|nr:DUF421 domain-containing protein [Neobacillus sp. PS3-40]WML44165.1 DUF421 domain-containing protein [Neobacillus sp. PS3-40]
MSASHIIANTIITFFVIYILSRILGKKLISQMTFFDFIAGISLGSLVGSVIFSAKIPIWRSSISLVVFAAISFIVDFIALKSYRGRKILNDVPTLIIKEGRILEVEMRKARLTIDDLLFQLRKKDIFYLDEIEYAFLETDGTVSALKKADKLLTTTGDLMVSSVSRGLPQTFIIDGNILSNMIKSIGKDEKWVRSILEQNNIKNVSDILVAQIDNHMNVFISEKGSS